MESHEISQRNFDEDFTISPNGFLFDHVSGLTYTLNKTSLFIIRRIAEGKSALEIVDGIADKFDVSHERANSDLQEFITQSKEFGVL
ncbi:MAG: PqqD family protein [Calditrichaeota bacterium]|nr:MAG: PqqD family protein [Calditrichota bacterium]